jgi:hypothetical protein
MPEQDDDTRELAVEEPAPAALEEGWQEDELELPPRPRRRLMTPLTGSLFGVLLLALGFIGGVEIQKGQEGSSGSGSAGSFASRFAGLRGASRTGTSTTGASGAAGFLGASGATTGQVTFIQGGTLYVETTEGTTVKVKTSAGSSVTKTVKGTVAGIKPGETVVVTGAKNADGSVEAESIRVGSTGGGLGALFGGSSSSSGTGSSSSSKSSTGTSGETQLFGR